MSGDILVLFMRTKTW